MSASLSRIMCLTPSRDRLAESNAPVGPQPQMTTSVASVSIGDMVDMKMYSEREERIYELFGNEAMRK